MGSCHVEHDYKISRNNIFANNTLLANHVIVEVSNHLSPQIARHVGMVTQARQQGTTVVHDRFNMLLCLLEKLLMMKGMHMRSFIGTSPW